MEERIVLHKFGAGEVLGRSWVLYLSHFKDILFVVLCIYVPIAAILALIPTGAIAQQYGTNSLRIYNLIYRAVDSLVGVVAIMAIAFLTEKAVKGESLPWSDALRHGASK